MSAGQGRHAGRHDGTGGGLLVLAAILAACVLLVLAALSASRHSAGPVTGAPGPQVTATMPAGPEVTVQPDAEGEHAAHLAHLARERREHARHEAHLAHLRREAALP